MDVNIPSRFRNPRKTWRIKKNIIMYINLEMLKLIVKTFGKGGLRQMMKIRFINSWKAWIWDRYLPESMKWNFGIMRLVSSKKVPTAKVGIFGKCGEIKLNFGGPKTIGFDDGFKTNGKSTLWNLYKIFEIWNKVWWYWNIGESL